MIQKEMLQYQQIELQLNKIEKELRQNSAFTDRKRFKALRVESEEKISKMDDQAKALRAQLAVAQTTLSGIAKIVEEHMKEIADIEDEDELKYMTKRLEKHLQKLDATEKEIAKIISEGEKLSRAFDEINKKLPAILNGYKKAKEDFDKATEAVKPQVAELKAKQRALEKVVDAEQLDMYKKLAEVQKGRVFVPLKDGNRCGGCMMEIFNVGNSDLQTKGYVRCENCGRIIYQG
ncbi:MAG: hypothetical protein IKC52_01130 [Clostridia bacterium]|nr:hypothetical protein [Clostridia bacterium]MBR2966061.1 hypothetical protein [Clostridia bacterium]